MKKYKFVKDDNNHIWEFRESHQDFLKITPWKKDEDRRKTVDEIDTLIRNKKVIPFNSMKKAKKIANWWWNNIGDVSWEYEGKHYIAKEKSCIHNFFSLPYHKFGFYDYRIVFYDGQIVWANPYHYYPRCVIFKFEGIDKTPKTNIWWQFTSIKNLHPIWCVETKSYI